MCPAQPAEGRAPAETSGPCLFVPNCRGHPNSARLFCVERCHPLPAFLPTASHPFLNENKSGQKRRVDVRKHWFWTDNFECYDSPKISGPALGGKKYCRHRFANGQFAQKFRWNFCCHGQPQNCFAPLKQKLGLQSKEKCRRHPLWLPRHFDDAMRPNFCFRGNVFLRQRA